MKQDDQLILSDHQLEELLSYIPMAYSQDMYDAYLESMNDICRTLKADYNKNNKYYGFRKIIPFSKTDNGRKIPRKPSEVTKEITHLKKILEKMSRELIGHIAINKNKGNFYTEYHDLIQALEQPYKPTYGRNPARDNLVYELTSIVTYYKIHPSTYYDGNLVNLINIILEVTNARYSATEIANDVINSIRFPTLG